MLININELVIPRVLGAILTTYLFSSIAHSGSCDGRYISNGYRNLSSDKPTSLSLNMRNLEQLKVLLCTDTSLLFASNFFFF